MDEESARRRDAKSKENRGAGREDLNAPNAQAARARRQARLRAEVAPVWSEEDFARLVGDDFQQDGGPLYERPPSAAPRRERPSAWAHDAGGPPPWRQQETARAAENSQEDSVAGSPPGEDAHPRGFENDDGSESYGMDESAGEFQEADEGTRGRSRRRVWLAGRKAEVDRDVEPSFAAAGQGRPALSDEAWIARRFAPDSGYSDDYAPSGGGYRDRNPERRAAWYYGFAAACVLVAAVVLWPTIERWTSTPDRQQAALIDEGYGAGSYGREPAFAVQLPRDLPLSGEAGPPGGGAERHPRPGGDAGAGAAVAPGAADGPTAAENPDLPPLPPQRSESSAVEPASPPPAVPSVTRPNAGPGRPAGSPQVSGLRPDELPPMPLSPNEGTRTEAPPPPAPSTAATLPAEPDSGRAPAPPSVGAPAPPKSASEGSGGAERAGEAERATPAVDQQMFTALTPPRRPIEASVRPPERPQSEGGDTITATGQMVVLVQAELRKRGYDPGRIDGRAGERTREAIRAFKRDAGMRSDGTIDDHLLERLGIVGRRLRPFESPS